MISTIDLRKPAPKESGMHHRADSAVNGGNYGYLYKSKGINSNVKNQHVLLREYWHILSAGRLLSDSVVANRMIVIISTVVYYLQLKFFAVG